MRSLGLGLRLTRGGGGIGAAFSVSIGSGEVITGTELTASVSGLVGGETVTYQWQDDGVNITGATSSTYTVAIGTDSVADASAIRCVITVDGGDPINSNTREVRYAAGSVTESAIADQTIDDDTWSVDFTSDFTLTNLTGSYVITGLGNGAVDDGDGTVSGGVTGSPASLTPVVTFTDQYGRTIVGNYSVDTVYRTQAAGGADLDLAYPEDSAITPQDLLANWTVGGNTLTLVSVSPALPTGLSVNSAGTLSGTPTSITADATYTLTMQDEYGRQTADTFTLEITAAAGTITFTSGTYTRTADGNSPTLNNTDVTATNTTGPYYLDLLSVTNGTTPSQTDMDNGSGTGVLEKVTLGPQADIVDLDGPLDLSVSITNGRIYQQYRDSAGTPAKSALTSTPTADAITYVAEPPAFSSAEIGTVDDTSLVVTFDKATYGSTTAADWDVQVDGSPATESAVAFTPGGTTADITLGAAVTSGQTVTVAYNGTGLKGVDGEVMATFTAQSVTNNVSGASPLTVTALTLVEDTSSGTDLSGTLDLSAYGSGDTLFVFAGPEQVVSTATIDGNSLLPEDVATGGLFGGRVNLMSFTLTGAGSATAALAITFAGNTNSKLAAPFMVQNGSLVATDTDSGGTVSTLSGTVTPTDADNVIIALAMGLEATMTGGVSWSGGVTEVRDATPVATDSGESYARADGAALSALTATMTTSAGTPEDAGLIVALFEAA